MLTTSAPPVRLSLGCLKMCLLENEQYLINKYYQEIYALRRLQKNFILIRFLRHPIVNIRANVGGVGLGLY